MKSGMIELTWLLQAYFAEHNIDPSHFTLGLKFEDPAEAYKLSIALKREITPLMMNFASADLAGPSAIDRGSFEMNGLKVEIESPLHRRA